MNKTIFYILFISIIIPHRIACMEENIEEQIHHLERKKIEEQAFIKQKQERLSQNQKLLSSNSLFEFFFRDSGYTSRDAYRRSLQTQVKKGKRALAIHEQSIADIDKNIDKLKTQLDFITSNKISSYKSPHI